MISVITPAYNASIYIGQTIESVIAQTYTDWEMIIVDDCSTDDTVAIINEYVNKDARIKLVRSSQNNGAAAARNLGVRQAQGTYIAFIDSDDLWNDNKLAVQIDKMESESILFTFTTYQIISKTGNAIDIVEAPQFLTYTDLLKGCNIGCSTVMYNAEALGKQYFLTSSPFAREDYVLWLHLTKVLRGRSEAIRGIDQPLVRYRKHEKGISSKKAQAACNQWRVYRKIEKLATIPSLYYFVNYAINGLKKHYF